MHFEDLDGLESIVLLMLMWCPGALCLPEADMHLIIYDSMSSSFTCAFKVECTTLILLSKLDIKHLTFSFNNCR